MENKKKIIVVSLILLSLFVFATGKFLINNYKSLNGGDRTLTVEDFIPNELAVKGFYPDKITLSDTYSSVIRIFGKPNTISEKQNMYNTMNAEPEGCLYLMYDNFFIIMRGGKVLGWYFNPENIDSNNDLIYLPGIKIQEEGTFLDFYKGWEKLSYQSYTETFSNFEKYSLGKIYFCVYYIDEKLEINQMNIYSYNAKYKLKQMYIFSYGKMVTRAIEAKDLDLLENNINYESMLLGRSILYIKNYLADMTLKRDMDDVTEEGAKMHLVSFVKGNIAYRFEFDEQKGICYKFSVSYII
jgi:hypothetical protein